jgi:hypothetical protein
MTTENKHHQFDEVGLKVLAFLKNLKQYAPDNFDYLIFYGASARELIKFLEQPEKFGRFDFRFVCSLFSAVSKTFQHYVVIRTEVPSQTMEEKIIASVLINSKDAFRSLYASERLINKSHLIAYLLRNNIIENWNSWLLFVVQRKVEELKAEMRLQFEIAG